MKTISAIFILVCVVLFPVAYFRSYVVEAWVTLNSTESAAQIKDAPQWEVELSGSQLDVKLEHPYFFDDGSVLSLSRDKEATSFHEFNEIWTAVGSFSDVYVRDLEFVSQGNGFLIGTRHNASSSSAEEASCLYSTSDRARSWTKVLCKEGILFTNIRFNPNGNGVLVGSQTGTHSGFILTTNDNGENWQDVSESYSRFASSLRTNATTGISNVFFSGSDLYINLFNRWIVKTRDMGNSWDAFSVVFSNDNQTGGQFFGVNPDGKPWIGGRKVSIEGKWSEVATLNMRGGWDFYQIQLFRFEDVKFLSNDNIIVAGAKVGLRNFGANPELDTGAILFSSNRGKDWIVAYQHDRPAAFISIHAMSEGRFRALADDGTVISIKQKK